MYIYKITVLPLNKVYIGFDTKPSYKLSRRTVYIKEPRKLLPITKLHKAMKLYGIDNCIIKIEQDNILTIGQLALSEIKLVKQYNSYQNGYKAWNV